MGGKERRYVRSCVQNLKVLSEIKSTKKSVVTLEGGLKKMGGKKCLGRRDGDQYFLCSKAGSSTGAKIKGGGKNIFQTGK